MGRNKQISCKVCSKVMRSDNVKRHMKKHIDLSLEDPEQLCKSILEDIVDNICNEKTSKDDSSIFDEKHKVNAEHSAALDDSSVTYDDIDDKDLEKILAYDDYEYKKKCKLGAKVEKLMIENGYHQESLRSEYKEALDLHLKKCVKSFPENLVFKPWQISLLEEVKIPTERKIIWVVGKSCGEGKTWLQNYIKYKYGDRRVVKGISLQTKSGHITHALTKHPLATADIFLFNIAKCVDTFTEINYDMLEGIKDGELFSSKYDSQRIKVKTPNIVMVFSNDEPNTSKLAKDRWKLFFIENDELKEQDI